MNTTEFVNRFNVCKTTQDKELFLQQRIKSNYILFNNKVNVCLAVVNTTLVDGNRFIKRSALQIIVFMLALIDTYTDINIDYTDSSCVKDYDRLKSNGLLEVLINLIPESEMLEFNLVMDCTIDDVEYSYIYQEE